MIPLDLFEKLCNRKIDLYLIHSRSLWESEQVREMGYDFTEVELNKAEKRIDGFIGKRNGINCYIQKPLIP